MSLNMLLRHLLALIVTISVYNFAPVPGIGYYAIASCWSLLYIAVVCTIAKTRITALLVIIETLAIATMFATYTEPLLAPESQWFYDYYARIMTTYYVAEIVVIIMGAAGGFKYVHLRWLNICPHCKSIFGSVRTDSIST